MMHGSQQGTNGSPQRGIPQGINGTPQGNDSPVSALTCSSGLDREQTGATVSALPPTTVTAAAPTTGAAGKRKTKPEHATIASMITVEDIQNSAQRLCGFLDPLCVHIQNKGTLPGSNSRLCVVCGNDCHEVCRICDVALHYTNTSPGWQVPCYFHYHNTSFFGLARSDWKMVGVKKSKFTIPDEATLAMHAKAMKELHAKTITKPNKTPSKLTDCSSSDNHNKPKESSDTGKDEDIDPTRGSRWL
jgi:hypothetical protein